MTRVALKVLLVFVCFVFLFLSAAASATNVPGGAIFVEDGNIVYHDFKTAEKISFTDGIGKQFGPNTNFAGSGDGITIYWADENYKIWVKSPNVKPMPVTIDFDENKDKSIWVDLVVPGAKNLACSFTGQKLSIEYPKKSKYSIDFCNAITYAQIDKNAGKTHDAITTYDISMRKSGSWLNMGEIWWHCNSLGNTAEPLASLASRKKGVNINSLVYTTEQAIPRFSIKRNAHFGCWSKDIAPDEQKLAVIYQTPLGWGPIEIRERPGYGRLIDKYWERKNTKKLTEEESQLKSGLYEIRVQLPICDGQAWKPDGSLTIFSKDKLYVIAKKDIDAGISQSGIEVCPDIGFSVAPRNNVFTVRPEIFAVEQGSGHYWVTDDQLVFRNKEGHLQLWENGKSEVIMDSIPVIFQCCNHPPFSQKIENSGAMSGESVAVRYGQTSASPIIAGDISIVGHGAWSAASKSPGNGILSINGGNLEFALAQERSLDQITDPTKYEYQQFSAPRRVRVAGAVRGVGIQMPTVNVPFGSIIMLKLDGKYAAIQPIAYEEEKKPYSAEYILDMNKDVREAAGNRDRDGRTGTTKDGRLIGLMKNVEEKLTYKWKYWPEIPTRRAPRIARNR